MALYFTTHFPFPYSFPVWNKGVDIDIMIECKLKASGWRVSQEIGDYINASGGVSQEIGYYIKVFEFYNIEYISLTIIFKCR